MHSLRWAARMFSFEIPPPRYLILIQRSSYQLPSIDKYIATSECVLEYGDLQPVVFSFAPPSLLMLNIIMVVLCFPEPK